MSSHEQLRPFLTMAKQHGVRELDTARVYNAGKSEEDVGGLPDLKKDFAIATKAPGFAPGSLSYQNVIAACNASLAAFKEKNIDLYYFHVADKQTPLEESCRAINDLYKEGKFDRFGVSNHSAEAIEEIHSICTKNGWILPSVYQGGYNALDRSSEKNLFPTLRKFGMVFYAFSPLAGGYFSRPTEQLRNIPAGSRMDQMKQFKNMCVYK